MRIRIRDWKLIQFKGRTPNKDYLVNVKQQTVTKQTIIRLLPMDDYVLYGCSGFERWHLFLLYACICGQIVIDLCLDHTNVGSNNHSCWQCIELRLRLTIFPAILSVLNVRHTKFVDTFFWFRLKVNRILSKQKLLQIDFTELNINRNITNANEQTKKHGTCKDGSHQTTYGFSFFH